MCPIILCCFAITVLLFTLTPSSSISISSIMILLFVLLFKKQPWLLLAVCTDVSRIKISAATSSQRRHAALKTACIV
jgi:hypothetical protein